MKESIRKKYAHLIAAVGANVQKGQRVILTASVDQYAFATLVAEECYKLGASEVHMEWTHQPLTKLDNQYRSLEDLSRVDVWKEEKLKRMAETLSCRIFLLSDDPDGLRGMDLEKDQKARQATYPIIKKYREAIESKHQWTIAAIPSEAWAAKVFPTLPVETAVEKLWEAILSTVRVNEDNDPCDAWDKHNENFRKRCEWLNSKQFDYLTYHSANGTDFRADLIPIGQWCGGGEYTQSGIYFNPNMPTEEIFTSPMAGKAEGKLVSTMPLSYQGQLIKNFWIRFENGSAVEWDAESGLEVLDKMLRMDEGARRLGELALVPVSSPISQSGILYYETLFDENASCHVALGHGYNDTIRGYMTKTNEECRALGINDSMIHVDFMVGAPDLCVTGWKNGQPTPIFINGEWAE